MKLLLFLAFLVIMSGASAQKKAPANTTELAEEIQQSYKNPSARIQAAYIWVTTNMRYNAHGILAMNHGLNPRGIIDVAFTRRSGVCENFAAIFTDICQKMGLQSVVIQGYTTHNDLEDKDGHSWSAVYTNNDWYLFDPTWDMGKTNNFNYFMKSGREFISTHIPFDPMWQMLEYPIGENDSDHSVLFNYKDSIDTYLSSDSLHRYESAATRIKNKKLRNKLTDTHLKVLQNELEIQRQEEQMLWYNEAVNYMNQAADSLNEFIDLRNEQFSKIKSEATLKKLLERVNQNLETALDYLERVDKSKAALVYGTDPAKEQLDRLRKKYLEQKIFLRDYLQNNTSKN